MQHPRTQYLSLHAYSLVKAVIIAFFLFHSCKGASPAALEGDAASALGRIPRSQQAMYTINLTGAYNFQLSYQVSPSISDDPFYTAPANSSGASAGTLLKVEKESNTSRYTLPPSLSLSRFMYQSRTSNNTLVPVTGFILWPYAARPHRGGIPIVAWAHGTSGSAPECAPSNMQNLWYQFQGLYEIALHGYAVIATDFAGLGVASDASGKAIVHEYATGPAQANDLFYSVPAARQAFPSLSEGFVTMGHSQGGGAAWAFAEKLAKEPMDGYLGTVALSPFTRYLDLPPEEPIVPAIVLFLIPNLQSNYAPFEPVDVLTPQGTQSLEYLTQLHGCTTVVYQLVGPDLLKPGWQNNSAIQKHQNVAASGGKPISGPFLVIQGEADPIIYPPTVEAAINDTAQKFPDAQIEFHLLPNVTHTPTMYAGLPIYLEWINARFAGEAARAGYHRFVATLARPPSSLQTESDWFIQKQLEPYQMS
jgi:pimeloyl-ACP methyl ester carboxylesterase